MLTTTTSTSSATAFGRAFDAQEDQPERNHVVIISHNLWDKRYGLNPQILGHRIMLDDIPHEIVGVMPATFAPPSQIGFPQQLGFFRPFGFDAENLSNRGDHAVYAITRLRPGATIAQAQVALATVSEGLAKAYPRTNGHIRVGIAPLRDDLVRNITPALRRAFGGGCGHPARGLHQRREPPAGARSRAKA
jgi:hypothetical protein